MTPVLKRAVCACVFLLSMAAPTSAQLHADALFSACRDKTKVVKSVQGKAQLVGEKIGGLCQGYLVGTYDAMIESKAICAPASPPSPDYLLSVVETYLKGEAAVGGKAATQVTQAAYLRAFPCKERRSSGWNLRK